MAGTRLQHLSILRGIVREFQLANQTGSPSCKFLLEKYKENQTTAAKYCRDPHAASYDAATYYCMLRSTRKYNELVKKYGGGESSIRKAAERVGLKLPEVYSQTEPEKTNTDCDK